MGSFIAKETAEAVIYAISRTEQVDEKLLRTSKRPEPTTLH
jgi:hypothetical protein